MPTPPPHLPIPPASAPCLQCRHARQHGARQGRHTARHHPNAWEAPGFAPGRQDPSQFLERLVAWGAPPGGSLACWLVRERDGDPAWADLEALAAAGCYPQRWGVPLTAAGVAAANAAAAAEPAQPPASKPGAAVAATQRANSAAAAAQRRRGGGPQVGAARRRWVQDGEGWWRCTLSLTAVGQASSQQTIGMKGERPLGHLQVAGAWPAPQRVESCLRARLAACLPGMARPAPPYLQASPPSCCYLPLQPHWRLAPSPPPPHPHHPHPTPHPHLASVRVCVCGAGGAGRAGAPGLAARCHAFRQGMARQTRLGVRAFQRSLLRASSSNCKPYCDLQSL